MITLLRSLAVGNAVQIFQTLNAGATDSVLLRKTIDTFSGHDDPDALIVAHGAFPFVTDITDLVNGQTYYYQSFWFDGTWHAETVKSAAPACTYSTGIVDPLTLIRDRLLVGLNALLAQGRLHNTAGAIDVLTAPPLFENTVWPVVTLHLSTDAPGERAIGEWFDDTSDGWLSRVQLQIIGWTLNPDERITLRKVLKELIIANLAVFDSVGMVEIDFSQSDQEDFHSFNAPVYQVIGTFSCMAPAYVYGAQDSAITDVQIAASV